MHEATYVAGTGVTAHEIVPSLKPANAPIRGRYITIISQVNGDFGLTEVRVIGRQTRLDSSGNTQAQVVPFSFTVLAPNIKTARRTLTTVAGYSTVWDTMADGKPITFTPNQTQDKVSFRAQFFEPCPTTPGADCSDGFKRDPSAFKSRLSSLNIEYTVNNVRLLGRMIDEYGEYTDEAKGVDGAKIDDVSAPENGIFFLRNISLQNTRPVQISVELSPQTNTKFRVVIDALTNEGTSVGAVTADFN